MTACGRLLPIAALTRIVRDDTQNSWKFFPGAARFIGTDIHPSPTVNQVADLPTLSADMGEEAVYAIFIPLNGLAITGSRPFMWNKIEELERVIEDRSKMFRRWDAINVSNSCASPKLISMSQGLCPVLQR